MATRRAHGPLAREARRQAILDAADALLATSGDGLPGVSAIAAAAGLAKGTVYLYFDTKEEIFAALLLHGWSDILDVLDASLAAGGRDAVAAFIAALAAELDRRPTLLRLDALGKGVLEGNMSTAALRLHKAAFHARLEQSGALVERTLAVEPGRGLQLLMRTYAFARGLWQSFGEAADDLPWSGAAKPTFAGEVTEALADYWRGALTGTLIGARSAG